MCNLLEMEKSSMSSTFSDDAVYSLFLFIYKYKTQIFIDTAKWLDKKAIQ